MVRNQYKMMGISVQIPFCSKFCFWSGKSEVLTVSPEEVSLCLLAGQLYPQGHIHMFGWGLVLMSRMGSYNMVSLGLHFTSLCVEHLSPAETFFDYVLVQRL